MSVTLKALPAVWVPGLDTLKVNTPAGLTVKLPVFPVAEPCVAVREVVAWAL